MGAGRGGLRKEAHSFAWPCGIAYVTQIEAHAKAPAIDFQFSFPLVSFLDHLRINTDGRRKRQRSQSE